MRFKNLKRRVCNKCRNMKISIEDIQNFKRVIKFYVDVFIFLWAWKIGENRNFNMMDRI